MGIVDVCEDCNGTGRDHKKTEALAKTDAEFRHRVRHHGTYIRCWSCNGNGATHYPDYSRHRLLIGASKC